MTQPRPHIDVTTVGMLEHGSNQTPYWVRMRFAPIDDPGAIFLSVGHGPDSRSWMMDRSLWQGAVSDPGETYGIGDVQMTRTDDALRIHLFGTVVVGSGEPLDAVLLLPVGDVEMFLGLVQESVPAGTEEYDIDAWIEEIERDGKESG